MFCNIKVLKILLKIEQLCLFILNIFTKILLFLIFVSNYGESNVFYYTFLCKLIIE
jgi:hypothetical protein